jgi:hypothetical protein
MKIATFNINNINKGLAISSVGCAPPSPSSVFRSSTDSELPQTARWRKRAMAWPGAVRSRGMESLSSLAIGRPFHRHSRRPDVLSLDPHCGSQVRGANRPLDSERFRSAPRTYWPLRGRLTQNGKRAPHVRHETARVHPPSQRRGSGVAARGTRAAGRRDAAHLGPIRESLKKDSLWAPRSKRSTDHGR